MKEKLNVKHYGPFKFDNAEEIDSQYFCACGLSKNDPFCDGSHKKVNKKPILIKTKKNQ